jgi:hypothetical protein
MLDPLCFDLLLFSCQAWLVVWYFCLLFRNSSNATTTTIIVIMPAFKTAAKAAEGLAATICVDACATRPVHEESSQGLNAAADLLWQAGRT